VAQWRVEPAWTMLEFDSFNALHDEPSTNNNAICLEPKLTATEVSASAVAVNTMLLLRRAAERGGLKLTATGNLSRAVVEGMLGIEWPDYDKAELFQYNKVIEEYARIFDITEGRNGPEAAGGPVGPLPIWGDANHLTIDIISYNVPQIPRLQRKTRSDCHDCQAPNGLTVNARVCTAI
jgi:hypothetical protein